MTSNSPLEGRLTDADYQYCVSILKERSPKTQEEIACLERLGFPVPELGQQDMAQRAQAELILREFRPHLIPHPAPSPVG